MQIEGAERRATLTKRILSAIAIALWPTFMLIHMVRHGFDELGSAVLGSMWIAAPVVGYYFWMKSQVASTLTGLALVGVRAWFITYLTSSESSTAGLMLFMVLIGDVVALGFGAIIDAFARRKAEVR